MSVRTRVAPSPTGDPHIGTAYVALLNQVFARAEGGQFVLRIEDTDVARSTRASERAIVDAFRWLGLDWDEGPDVGGAYGPYRQSERRQIYLEHAHRLLDAGDAFYCFCSPARLETLRAEQSRRGESPKYDGHCLAIDADTARRRVAAGDAHVIRMKVPSDGICRFEDRLRGTIEIPYAQIDMQVLIKGDGYPTYHLAVVVDDHLMKITHILRGEEWINSVPKHVLLYGYFGWQPPVFCHLPLLRNPDRSKLSKRKNPTSINYYRRAGYLPEALINYLGRMGWSMPGDKEIFGRDEMIEAFDLSRVSLGAPVFDFAKLNWLNGQYIRRLAPDEFMDHVQDWAFNRDRLSELVPLVQERTERFLDIVPQVDYLLGERRALTASDFAHKSLDVDTIKRVLQFMLWSFDDMRGWEKDEIQATARKLAAALGVEIRDFLFPLFVAVAGRAVALPLFDSIALLGADLTRIRLRDALTVLGGVSKQAAKQMEKQYRAAIDSKNSGE